MSEDIKTNTEEFDWESFELGIKPIDQVELDEIHSLYNESLNIISESEVIDGIVTQITDRDVIIDVHSKSEGVISLNEFRYNPDLKVGDTVSVLVDKIEDGSGQLKLSHKKARTIRAWERINKAHETGEIINGTVQSRTKGGMIVDIFGIEAFLPGSQIDVKPIRDYDQYVDKQMEFKVVKINHEFKNIVVSHKALIEADLEIQKKEIISQLEKGQVLEGQVKNITSYGAFLDLGGVDGLVHITDLSWSRVNHPSDVLELDQTIKVVILDFDEEKTKIQLGVKQLEPHPWEALDTELKPGDKINGKVVVIADYGAFVEVVPGVEGLVHVSEMSWSTHLRSAGDFVSVGDQVEAVIISLDREERKLSLGFKQLTPDPWTDITSKYAVGSRHEGIVRNFTNFGMFVELEEGVDGLIHITDLSWTKKIKHPSDFTTVGAKIEVQVLELDTDNRKLSLGHKQVTNNPWDEIEEKYDVGTKFTAVLNDVFEKGGKVNIETAGIEAEAFVPASHLEKEDGTKAKKGEELEFIVIEFNKDLKRIVLSHSVIFKPEREKMFKRMAEQKTEKSTLGDLDALSSLKSKMEGRG